MARRERKACLSYCRLSCYLSFHMSRLKKSLLLSFFFFVCLFVFLRRGEGEGRLKDDKKRIIMRSFSRPKWMTIKSSQPHKHYKSNTKSKKKSPSSRIRTSDLRISINVSTVLRSTNWAIEGTFNMIAFPLRDKRVWTTYELCSCPHPRCWFYMNKKKMHMDELIIGVKKMNSPPHDVPGPW